MAVTTPNGTASLPDARAPASSVDAALAIFTESVDFGGTERVVQALADRFPAARIVANHFPAVVEPGDEAAPWMTRARLLLSGRRKRHFLGPLYARRLAGAQVEPARVVLTLSCGGWGLAAPRPEGGRLVCYSTGPPPALYGETRLYLQTEIAPLRPFMRGWVPALRLYYRHLMRRPDRVLTVSRSSADVIERVYGRTAEVIHPPVRTTFFTPTAAHRRHFLAVARLVPQKRLDLLIETFRRLDETLVIAGHGPWLDRLRACAPTNVRLTGWVDDATLRELYRSSRALICPSVEEFGIVMAEAHACGTPVIAPRQGGALEIVTDATTGLLLEAIDERSIAAAVEGVREAGFDPLACRASAERFAEKHFMTSMERVLVEELAGGR